MRRALVFATLTALLLSTGPAPAETVRSAGAEPLAAPATPAERAKALGERVEVPEMTSPTTQVFAEPDGTFTMEQHPVPVRAHVDGTWVPLDLTLRTRSDGAVAPAAAAVSVTFSGGGDEPMVRLAAPGGHVELTWPGRLPKPVLDGDTATYREVLPDVDLRLRAVRQGFAHALVVKNRPAARALARVSFGLRASGLTLRHHRDGSVAAVGTDGEEVLRTSLARMWDSGAQQARRDAVMPVELAGGRLTLVPDQKLLTDPATRYPVTIDPDWGVGRAAWALVYGLPADYTWQSYWFGDGDNVAKVGFSDWEYPTVRVRSYFQFDVAPLWGKHILNAQFNVFENWAATCTPTDVVLHETGAIGPGTSWNAQPWIGQVLGVQAVAGGRAGCPSRWVGFEVGPAVANSVAARSPTTTLMLRAGNENDRMAWKNFDPNNPALIVRFNSYPNTPTALTVEGLTCGVVPSQPYVYTTGPRLRATVSDPDGGGVQAKFEWYVRGGAKKGETTTLPQSSGTQFAISVPTSAYRDGDTLSWRVQAFDGIDWSPWSGWCEATIDRTAPNAPPGVTSTDYPEHQTGGGVGRTGRFTFTAGGVSDVVGYRYDLHDQPQRYVAAASLGGSATALVTPPNDRPASLYVRSVDRAGNLGPMYRYDFRAGSGTPPSGHWRLDGFATATTAPDGTGRGFTGTVAGGAGAWWTAGRQDDAIAFDGRTGHVATTGGAPIRTDSTFTVAAWVRVDSWVSGWHTAVSQDGNRISGYLLQLNPNDRKWNFMIPASDADNATRRIASSTAPATLGRWTHLVGVFDRAVNQITLYVDGVAQQTTAHPTPWHAGGSVQIGRARYAAAPSDYWPGAVDDVRVYDRLLSTDEIHQLATAPTATEGFWPLDETTGTTATDVSGNRRDATASGGVTWTEVAMVGPRAAAFDGVSGELTTQGPAVRTDQSFTVSALVRLENADGVTRAAVSQDGPRSSGFALRYQGGKWVFALSPGDADNPAWVTATAPDPAIAGEWTSLTGVYDRADRQVRLYVNGAVAAAVPVSTSIANVAGPLVVGRAKQAGGKTAFWSGQVDNVIVHTGVRTADQIADESRDPSTERPSLYSGQFTRWRGHSGDHMTTSGRVPVGYHFEGPLGFPAPDGAPNTRMLYSCLYGTDEFTSITPDCEGRRVLGELGLVYTTPPENVPVKALYRCMDPANHNEHFLSRWSDCEGKTVEGVLGYTADYSYLIRYREKDALGEHRSATHQAPATYQPETRLGILGGVHAPGAVSLMLCRDGTDTFSSTDAACEGAEVVEWSGSIWPAQPSGVDSVPLLRCVVAGDGADRGERFDSVDPGCEGQTIDRQLGYVLSNGVPSP